jgi:hypothetical protein
MDPRIMKSFSDHLLLGGAIVAIGSAAGLWLPFGAAVLLLALLWSRVSWIEQSMLSAGPDSPRLRQRARGWIAFSWAVAAGAALQAIVPLTVAVGALALFLALRQADYLALGAAELQAAAAPRPTTGEKVAPAALPRRPD